MFNDVSCEQLMDEIGRYLGFEMWNDRDTSKSYDFPGARGDVDCLGGDQFVKGDVIVYNSTELLVYKNVGCFHGVKTLYTFNLTTLKPTKNSKRQTLLPQNLIEKIKNTTFIPTTIN